MQEWTGASLVQFRMWVQHTLVLQEQKHSCIFRPENQSSDQRIWFWFWSWISSCKQCLWITERWFELHCSPTMTTDTTGIITHLHYNAMGGVGGCSGVAKATAPAAFSGKWKGEGEGSEIPAAWNSHFTSISFLFLSPHPPHLLPHHQPFSPISFL